jgi:hypothetical protein
MSIYQYKKHEGISKGVWGQLEGSLIKLDTDKISV